ncbi:MAG: integration host factor subunit alpha [Mariprofundaceae bacterium]
MTKAEIAEIVHEHVGLPKKESALIVEGILDTIRSTLESGEDVKISGFGHFALRDKNPRRGRNPKTGEEIMISARRVVTFSSSNLLVEQMNKGS